MLPIDGPSLQKILQVSRIALWKWSRLGLPVLRQGPGRPNRYDLTAVLSWLQSSRSAIDFRAGISRLSTLQREIARREAVDSAGIDAVAHAETLALRAAAALEGGHDADLRELRAALRAVPPSRRAALEMPMVVWDALTADVRRLELEVPIEDEDRGIGSDQEADEMGTFWYEVACGTIYAETKP